MQNLRIKFSKTGDAKYISHLDLMRCMQRAIQRADIPIMYTEGFNPRPNMNFVMPLSLGIEGTSELVDIRIDDSMTPDEVLKKLELVMPRDIKILEVWQAKDKANTVAFSKYRIEISQDKMSVKDFNDAVSAIASKPELLVSKLGKQGKNKVVKQINLTEHLQDVKIWESNTQTSVITLVLPSNPQFGVNPNLLTTRIFEDLEIEPIFCHIVRKSLLKADMTLIV